jgi:hypothetical protein
MTRPSFFLGIAAAAATWFALMSPLPVRAADVKDDARQAGRAAGSTVRDIGQGAKNVGKEIGQGAKKVGNAVADVAKDGVAVAKEGGKEFKRAVNGK